jgi:DNA polymerase-3 subunit delta'
MMHWLVAHKQSLSAQWQNNILPHAIIITGLKGAGTDELCAWLVDLIACQQPLFNTAEQTLNACKQCKSCLLKQKQNFPDHLTLSIQTRSIGVDEVRQVSRFFEKTAQLAQSKTVLIEQADKMTTSAANALLKTLEEPQSGCYIFLQTHDVDRLLPTITSRCRILAIKPPAGESLIQQSSSVLLDKFSNISAMAELTQVEIEQDFLTWQANLFKFLEHGVGLSDVIQAMTSNEHSLRWLEKVLVQSMRAKQHWQQEQNLLCNLSDETINQCYALLINCSKKIKQLNQANNEFLLEQLLVEWQQIMMAGAK